VAADLIWKPIAQKINLETKSMVYISPDGPLNLMPFEALPTADGKYLIEKVKLGYVSSGKDFLRSKKPSNRSGALLVGAVDFNLGLAPPILMASAAPTKRGQCGKLNELQWQALPGTASEVDAIAAGFKKQNQGVTLLKGQEAEEAKIQKAMQSARYLHLATHGFFLGDECGFAEEARGIGGVRPGAGSAGGMMLGMEASGPVRKENPLLLSGLALAGANNSWKGGRGGGENDGYLLAMEVANLDLEGVELVTLSACQTGLGEIKRGEGVFGLKRSFMIAGAESLVMSLWSVPDKETKELMIDFYTRILAQNPRRDSFCQSQLKLMKSGPAGAYRHPYYWAAFQYIGVN
jgi:CHAT domain-containing protein